MASKILVAPTICHTGTYLLLDILKKYRRVGLRTKPEPGTVYNDHLYPHNIERLKELMGAYPSIVPLRHPTLTALSWVKRNRDLGEMCIMWYQLVERLDRYNPHYLPVDHPDRDGYLDDINKSLGLSLTTEWPLINSKHQTLAGSLEDLPEWARIQTERLIRNISDFLSRFYPQY